MSDQVVIDRVAASIIDGLTNAVARQFPDEAVLRRRAYYHALDRTKGRPTRPFFAAGYALRHNNFRL